MAPVGIKFVVSFSSQDTKYLVESFVRGDSTKWLCAAGDRSGHMEAIFQLERSCKVTHIDIGTYWAFCASIHVGKSTWPVNKEYASLLPTVNFMNPADSKMGTNKVNIRMFKYADFSEASRDEEWDRIRIVLTQPFRKDAQFGLQLLRITGADNGDNCQTSSELAMSSGSSALSAAKSTSEIQKHFFGAKTSNDNYADALKSRLAKIGSSTESGQGAQFSRNMQFVMAAATSSPRYRMPAGVPANILSPAGQSTHSARKHKLTFEEEISRFHQSLDVSLLDLDKLKFSDLRHKFEKIKMRKLSKEEKTVFMRMTEKFIAEAFEEIEKESNKSEAKSASSEELTKESTRDACASPHSIFRPSKSSTPSRAGNPQTPAANTTATVSTPTAATSSRFPSSTVPRSPAAAVSRSPAAAIVAKTFSVQKQFVTKSIKKKKVPTATLR